MPEQLKQLIITVIMAIFAASAGWAARHGFDADSWTQIGLSAGGFFATLGVDAVLRLRARFLEPPKDPAPPYTYKGQPPLSIIVLALIVPALLMMAGCETTPAKRYAGAMVALDGVNTAFNSAAKAHLLTDRQIVAAEPLFKAVDRQVQILQEEYETNGTVNETVLKSLENGIDAIQEWLARTKARK